MDKIYNTPIEFRDGFENIDDEIKLRILRAMEEKYGDWDEMIARKYEVMRGTFSESGKSKLRATMTDESVIFKYPEVNGNNYKFMGILNAQGKGIKSQAYYYRELEDLMLTFKTLLLNIC